MKLGKLALSAAVACTLIANVANAENNPKASGPYSYSACDCDVDCGCKEPDCGCESQMCCDGGCDSGCDSCGCGLAGDCCLGDPWTLFGDSNGWSAGGWMQLGYHTADTELFNTRPNEVQLQQSWLYAEKVADGTNGFGLGGRIDYVYGTDGPNTQAFGTDPNGWDNSWDNGGDYGHAIPQLYMEAAYGDLSVKAGHFYTLIGYEVVAAPDNFFLQPCVHVCP